MTSAKEETLNYKAQNSLLQGERKKADFAKKEAKDLREKLELLTLINILTMVMDFSCLFLRKIVLKQFIRSLENLVGDKKKKVSENVFEYVKSTFSIF